MRQTSFLLFLLITVTLNGQYGSSPDQVDSMERVLSALPRDSSRTPVLVNLWRAHINNDVPKAMSYSRRLLELGRELNNIPIQHTGYQRTGIAYSYLDMLDSSNHHYRKALQLSLDHQAYAPAAAMEINIAINHQSLNNFDSVYLYAHKAQAHFARVGDSAGVAACYGVLANSESARGYYRIALEHALKAARLYRTHGDSTDLADIELSLSRTYLKIGDTLSAVRYLETAIDYYQRMNNQHFLSQAMGNLGVVLVEQEGKEDQARKLLEESAAIARRMQAPSFLLRAYFGLGLYYRKSGSPDTGADYLARAAGMADSLGNEISAALSLQELARVHFMQQRPQLALSTNAQALAKALKTESLETQRAAYLLESEIHQSTGSPEAALTAYKKYQKVDDSIYNLRNSQRMAELQTIYETEQKITELALQEEEIRTLNEKARAERLSKGLYAGGMVSFIAVSGLLFFGFRQRMKRNRIAREKQEAIYRQEIEHKKKELASQTLHLVQKNTFLEELMENLSRLKNNPDQFKVEFRRIVMLLKKEKASDKDWEIFKTYFAEVHDDFDQKLKTLSPDLSEKEIRLAAFLRMNLTTKEIAATLNVLPDSVLKSKYRLKKRLGLERESDLGEFLARL